MNERVRITKSEWYAAATVGLIRYVKAHSDNRREPYGKTAWPVDVNVNGAAGETAVCKYFGVFPLLRTDPDKHLGDVGSWQVKTQYRVDSDSLRIHPDDRDADRVILVLGGPFVFHIRGYYIAGQAKRRPDWFGLDPRKQCYCVPLAELLDIDREAARRDLLDDYDAWLFAGMP